MLATNVLQESLIAWWVNSGAQPEPLRYWFKPPQAARNAVSDSFICHIQAPLGPPIHPLIDGHFVMSDSIATFSKFTRFMLLPSFYTDFFHTNFIGAPLIKTILCPILTIIFLGIFLMFPGNQSSYLIFLISN